VPLNKYQYIYVPDKRSRILEVVVVRRIFNLGTGDLEWGGNGKGLRKGRSEFTSNLRPRWTDPVTARRVSK
jgi:hypothetical protein